MLAVAVAVALTGCGDSESDQEKAQNQVCDARADIQKQLDELGDASLGTATLGGIEQRLQAIKADLTEMKDAQASLSDERRQQVESATEEFGTQVDSIVDDLSTSRSLSGALTALQNALVQLRDGYQQALEPIDCG